MVKGGRYNLRVEGPNTKTLAGIAAKMYDSC